MSNPISDLTGAVKAGAEAINNCTELLKTFYGDALQPAAKKAGKALETVVGYSNVPLLNLRLRMMNAEYYESAQAMLFKRRLQDYFTSLDDIPEAEIAQVPNEIGVPILEKLTYVADDDIAKLYITLLASASNEKNSDKAHPGFIKVIESISPDEAKLIDFFAKKRGVFFGRTLNDDERRSISEESGILRTKNLIAYLQNLEGLGIIKIQHEIFESLGAITFTSYGLLFFSACTGVVLEDNSQLTPKRQAPPEFK